MSTVLVVGSGGREHALAWKLSQSARVQKVYVAPGNGGTASDSLLVNVAITDHDALADFEAVKAALEAKGLKPEIAEVTMRAENPIELTGDDAARMQKLIDVIEDLDDVQDVFHNASLSP